MSSNTSTRQRLSAVSLTAMLVLSVFAGAVFVGPAAAAGNADHDNESAATTATSDILAGTTVGNVDGSSDNYTVARTISDTNDTEYVLEDADGGYVVYANDSLNFEGENTTHQFHSANISHDELLDLEHQPGENVSVTSTVYNTTNVSRSDAVSDSVTAYIEWDNTTATETISDADVDEGDVVEVTSEEATSFAGFDLPFSSGTDKSRIEAEDKEIPTETLYVAAANGSVADDFSTTLGDFDSEGTMSSVLAFRGPNALVAVSSDDTTRYVPVYAESAPDSVDTDDDTYAVVKSVSGTDMIVLQNLDEVEGWESGDEVDITAAAGTGTSGFFVGYLTQSLGLDGILSVFSGFGGLTASFGGVAALGVAGAAARRRMEG